MGIPNYQKIDSGSFGATGATVTKTFPKLGSIKEIVIRVQADLVVSAGTSGLLPGAIPKTLMSSLSVNSTKHAQIVNNASGLNICDLPTLLGKSSAYVSVAGVPYGKNVNFASAAVIAGTAATYAIAAVFRIPFYNVNDSQPQNLFWLDSNDETISLSAILGTIANSYAVPATTALANGLYEIGVIVTPEKNYAQQLASLQNAIAPAAIQANPAAAQIAKATLDKLNAQFPAYPTHGLIRKVFVKNQPNVAVGSSSVDLWTDSVPRVTEGIIQTVNAAATPFALADNLSSAGYQLQFILPDGTTSAFDTGGEIIQELFYGDSYGSIYGTGSYPVSFYGPLGSNLAYIDSLRASQASLNYAVINAASNVNTMTLVSEFAKA